MKKATLGLILTAVSLFFWCSPGVKAGGTFELTHISARDVHAAAAADTKNAFNTVKPGKADGKPAAQKEWTVMVFMNAKNNLTNSQLLGVLGKWAEKDIAEMKKVGTTNKVNVVVEHGAKGKGSKRMLIRKNGMLSNGEKIYGKYPNSDMGDYRRVIEFVKWAKATFPAKRYMLILWNHGMGWMDPDMAAPAPDAAASDKGILFDDETKNYVRTGQLGDILRQTGYVDVFAMNACLMQTAEVAYEAKDNTGLIVASEDSMLAWGFDYEKLLNFMNAGSGAANEQISDFFINWERDFYAAGIKVGTINVPLSSVPGAISTVRPQALHGLPRYLDAFAGAAIRNNETDAVKKAIETAVRFTSIDPKNDRQKMFAPCVDLYDFALIVGQNSKARETRRAAENLMAFIKSELVMRSIGLNYDLTNGYDYTRVGGIAINMTMKAKTVPPKLDAMFGVNYGNLALSKASQWDEFVTWADGVWRK